MDVLALLTNPATIVAVLFLWGLVVKYHPKLEGLPNALIPWMNAVIALLAKLAAPAAAHAGTLEMAHPLVLLSFWGGIGGFLTPVLQAGWQAVSASLIYEVFARTPLEKGLGWRSPSKLPAPPVRSA